MKSNYLIEISEDLVNLMLEFSNKTLDEVCGILIGKEKTPKHIIITNILPDKNALNASKFAVTRNTKSLYPEVKDIVEKSLISNVDFIGDWHSHPSGSLMYSSIDYYSMNTMLKDPDYCFLNSIVLIIVCPPNKISSYLFPRDKTKPIKMKILKNTKRNSINSEIIERSRVFKNTED